jgi:DNA-binding SARP family transcriptional activator/Tfp pilus assembly protein PilF
MNDAAGASPRFGVLGPLRVWRGEDAVDLGPLQQRVVLAVLLLHAGRPVAREQMISAVWGEEPPVHAVNLVQRHVSGLRRVLGAGGPGGAAPVRLVWTDAGYLLTLPAGALDLEVFEGELGRARAARAAGDLAEAAAALHSALGLWRGPVCDGLSSPYLDAQRDRLAESRISVVEDRIELDLALGSHTDLIAELRELLAGDPLRERLHGLLMLALYRAGRQADALAAFRDARQQLNDELGVEPAAPLQRLHQQILAADPQLAAAARAAPIGTTPIGGTLAGGAPAGGDPQAAYRRLMPAQLPHGSPDFTNRDTEIGLLNALLPGDDAGARGPVIAAVAGTAGVGKSALAVHWAHQVRNRFPDGQLYVNLRGFDPGGSVMDPTDAIRGFLDAFAVPADRIPVDLDAQGALYRSMLAGLRVLILLDNARDGAQVRPLLPGSPGCLVVVTSRNQLISLAATDGAHPVPLDLLGPGDARRLFARRLGRRRVAAEPAAVEEIIDACAGLALALSVVTARAAANPKLLLASLAEELRDTSGGLDALDAGDKLTNVRTVFSWSYHALSEPAARLFRLLGLHAGPDIGGPAAASLAGLPPAGTRTMLTELTRAHLLTDRGGGRFTFHDLLRAYAGELAGTHDSAADRRAAVHRMLDHYLHSAYRADGLLRQNREDAITVAPVIPLVTPEVFPDHHKALAWFGTEYHVLLAALRQAASEGFDAHTWQLAWALTSFFDYGAHWHDAAASHRAALAAANRLADPHAQAVSHGCLAEAYIRLGRRQDGHAHLLKALGLYEQLGDHRGQGHTHRILAWAFDTQGSYREALPHAERAFELFQTAGYPAGQANALNAVGWFHVQLGDYEEGLVNCQRALDLQKGMDDRFSQAHTLDSIGMAYHLLGRHRQAADHYQQAVDLFHDFGDRDSEAESWTSLGDTHLAADDPASAGAAWQHALAILDELGHPGAEQVRERLAKLAGLAGAANHSQAAGVPRQSPGKASLDTLQRTRDVNTWRA